MLRFLWVVVVWWMWLVGPAASLGEAVAVSELEVESLVRSLADTDPAVREFAVERLVEIGEPARVALRRALSDPDPAVASVARSVLGRLPWTLPDDPAWAVALLRDYGSLDSAGRMRLVERLLGADEFDRFWDGLEPARMPGLLLRLIDREWDVAFGWMLYERLRSWPPMRGLEVRTAVDADLPPPSLALRGWLQRSSDPAASRELIGRALNETAEFDPQLMQGVLPVLFDMLVEHAIATHDFRSAVSLLERRVELFGDLTLADLTQNLLVWSRVESGVSGQQAAAGLPPSPLVLLAMGRCSDLNGQFLLGDAWVRAGLGLMLSDAQMASQAMQLTSRMPSPLLSRRVAARVVRTAAGDEPGLNATARLRLYHQARALRDWSAAESNLKQAVASVGIDMFIFVDADGQTRQWDPQEIRDELDRLELRVALDLDDRQALTRLAGTIADGADPHGNLALEQLLVLERLGMDRTAEELIERVLKEQRRKLAENPDDPMLLNNAAWFLARGGIDAAEARRLASRAVELQPQSFAYLDTLAEAEFRLGNRERAIELQTRALQLHPGDRFLTEQLVRFRHGEPERGPLPGDD